MKALLRITIIFFVGLLMSYPLHAQEKKETKSSKFKNALNICPIAPLFGIYALNFEHLFDQKNGLVVRIEYEDVPKAYTEANIESNGVAFSLNYRRHIDGQMESLFWGAFARYRTYKGDGELDSGTFDFNLPSFTLGLNAGKRWVWDSGFNITVSLGYGYSTDGRNSTPNNNVINEVLDQLEKEYDFMTPLYGEVSIGFAF